MAQDQFLLAALDKPRRLRPNWQNSVYGGPHARRDADERSKWVQVLASILADTQSLMGQVLADRFRDVRGDVGVQETECPHDVCG